MSSWQKAVKLLLSLLYMLFFQNYATERSHFLFTQVVVKKKRLMCSQQLILYPTHW